MNVLSFPFPLVILLGRQKPGKWCAMHVRVAYMILRHQEKMKVLGPEGWGEREWASLSPEHLPLAELGRIAWLCPGHCLSVFTVSTRLSG